MKTMMKRILLFFLVSVCMDMYGQSMQELLPVVKDAIFTVYAELDNGLSQGSGFFISPNGVGVTNFHVLQGALKAYVKDNKGNKYSISEVVDYSPNSDLVKFKVANPENIQFHYLNLCEAPPAQGNSIINVSSPLDLEYTVSNGIISSVRNVDGYGSVIQITAPISHGSSGSPVMNMQGQVVGIATFGIEEGQSLNFAIDVSQLKKLNKNIKIKISEMSVDSLETVNVRNARKYIIQGDYQKAFESLSNEINLNPKNHVAYNLLSGLFYDDNQFEPALKCAFEASKLKPDCAEYYNSTGKALILDGINTHWKNSKDLECALESYGMALKFDSINADAYYGIGKTLYEYNSHGPGNGSVDIYNDALGAFSKAINISPNPDMLCYRADVYSRLHEYGKAVLDCDKAIALAPDFFRGYFCRGDIKALDLRYFNDGLIDIERALELVTNDKAKADILGIRGIILCSKAFLELNYESAVNLGKGLMDFDESLKLNPSSSSAERKEEALQMLQDYMKTHSTFP